MDGWVEATGIVAWVGDILGFYGYVSYSARGIAGGTRCFLVIAVDTDFATAAFPTLHSQPTLSPSQCPVNTIIGRWPGEL